MMDALHLEGGTHGTGQGGEYRGICCAGGTGRAYGGHLVAQALLAASRTVDAGRSVHSLHAYFLERGRPEEEIRYQVHALRNGGSYALRQVTAHQGGNRLLIVTASFKRIEGGVDRHTAMPAVPAPESLSECGEAAQRFWSGIAPTSLIRDVVRVRPVPSDETIDAAGAQQGARNRRMWFRVPGAIPEDPAVHAAALAFCSDLTVARTAALGHLSTTGGTPSQRLFLTSLDHAIWFHRPCRVDDWLLFVHRSRTSGDGRGLTEGEVWTRDGTLIATIAQEVLLRERRGAPCGAAPLVANTV
ncbi:acyl-CoA thioesterase II [Nocardia sp. MDA0666]|uniref:acyl-CoA thioesterase n=1 Tax=Nocardia sp. MDA0666 TaxID=2135448 RepID=UPI000D11CC98|nr:acyl-CoA thioesterase domain-containing protein [Nocardia sp. MDA0666]PSR68857.1 acyl-CoA thioesterase II [Nocardia sp. MDA0666]